MNATTSTPENRAAETFSLLTAQLQGFVDAWEAGNEPTIARFLPRIADEETRRLCLAELIKIDLEYRWGDRNRPKRIAEYVAEFPELAEGGFPIDVIYEEFHLRRNSGFAVDPREYIDAFPDQASELRRLLDGNVPYESTAITSATGKGALEGIVPGERLGDFELLAELGAGAFAKVFLARQISMQRLVALKISANSGTEHQMLARFDHESIVRVYDHVVDPQRDLRLLYMQYVPGGTLQGVVRELRSTDRSEWSGAILLRAVDRALDARGESRDAESSLTRDIAAMTWPEAVCWIGARLADALDYAHSRGVLHRDVKPANVLVNREGVPKLADFNISFASKQEGASAAAYFGGSLAYMSVEQLEACNPASGRPPDDLDGRSDLYTLGVVLWELLVGERPFVDGNTTGGWPKKLAAMSERRRGGLPVEARENLPENCPRGLVRVLERCLAPDREQRWQSGGELARQLDACRDEQLQALFDPPPESWTERVRRWPVLLVFLAALVPNALAGVFNFFYNQREIVEHLNEESIAAFMRIQTCVNAVLYPLGLGLAVYLASSVSAGIARLERGETLDDDRRRALRRRCLALGHSTALIGLAEWTLAGFLYPIAMHLAAGEMPLHAYVHFWASLVLCGLVATSYPFFGVTAVALRGLYPRLVGHDLPREDVPLLERLTARTWGYLLIGVTVPFACLFVLGLMEGAFKFALVLLSGFSLIGFGFVYWLFGRVQGDIAALLRGLANDRTR